MTGAVHRAQRITMWSLRSSLFLGWLGVLAGIANRAAEDGVQPVRLAAAFLALGVFTWSGFAVARDLSIGWPSRDRRSRWHAVASGMAVLVVLITLDASPAGAGLMAAAWISVIPIRTSRPVTLLLSAGTVAVCLLAYRFNPGPDPIPLAAVAVIYSALCFSLPWANRLWVWILDLTEQAHASKDAEARLAVTEERLRFARDLHDLVGHSLSVIAVKSELAGKLIAIDTERAAGEMTAVRGLAQDSLRQIRQAVRGYRVLDLSSEVASVRAILEADGVRCDVDLPDGGVDPEAAGPLAWVVRESATNILRHSKARWCTITLWSADGSAILEVINDGVSASVQTGTGLAGLAERLAAVGGSLTAQPTGDGRFLVRAVAPAAAA